MSEEVNIPQNTDDAMPGMPTFADLEKLAEQSNQAGELSGEAKDESDSQGLEQSAPVVPDKPAFQEKMQKHGFKTEDDLLKSYEEAHVKITKLSQSEADTKRQIDYLAQQYNQALQVIQQQVGQGQGQQPQGNEELFREVAPLVEQLVNQKVQGIKAEIDFKDNMKAVKAKQFLNPDEFNELVPHMAEVIKEHPYLDRAEHLNTVYEKAKEKRDTSAMKLISVALGPNVDMDKVRKFFSKDPEGQGQPNQDDLKAAFIPSSSSGSRPMDSKPVDYASEIRKAQESGDIEKVIKLTVQRDSFKVPAASRR